LQARYGIIQTNIPPLIFIQSESLSFTISKFSSEKGAHAKAPLACNRVDDFFFADPVGMSGIGVEPDGHHHHHDNTAAATC